MRVYILLQMYTHCHVTPVQQFSTPVQQFSTPKATEAVTLPCNTCTTVQYTQTNWSRVTLCTMCVSTQHQWLWHGGRGWWTDTEEEIWRRCNWRSETGGRRGWDRQTHWQRQEEICVTGDHTETGGRRGWDRQTHWQTQKKKYEEGVTGDHTETGGRRGGGGRQTDTLTETEEEIWRRCNWRSHRDRGKEGERQTDTLTETDWQKIWDTTIWGSKDDTIWHKQSSYWRHLRATISNPTCSQAVDIGMSNRYVQQLWTGLSQISSQTPAGDSCEGQSRAKQVVLLLPWNTSNTQWRSYQIGGGTV